jgi:surface protein
MANQTILTYNLSFLSRPYTITLPITSLSPSKDVTTDLSVTWSGLGVLPTPTSNPLIYSYTTANSNILTLTISGPNVCGIDHYLLNSVGTILGHCLITCEQIGTGITSLERAFFNSYRLISVPSTIPNTVTSMAYMFYSTGFTGGNMSNWDTSNVTTMESMFQFAENFDGDISNWNTSKVITMKEMFNSASKFNQNINTNGLYWDVSKVQDMRSIFIRARLFNGNISGWNPSSAIQMSGMFSNAEAFDQDISGWVTTSAQNMEAMFYNAKLFNQNIGGWNTNNVTNMSNMFNGALKFNQNIGGWNISKVNVMSNMLINTAISIGNYDGILNGWGKASTLSSLKSNVTLGATGLQYTVIGKVGRDRLVTRGWNIQLDILRSSTILTYDFSDYNAESYIDIQLPIKSMSETSVVTGLNVNWSRNGENVNLNHPPSNNPLVYRYYDKQYILTVTITGNNVNWLDHSDVYCRPVYLISCSNIGNEIINLQSAFENCRKLITVPLTIPNTITNMTNTFFNAEIFNGDISSWNTASVTTMLRMFYGAKAFNCDINTNGSYWNVSNVVNMISVFEETTNFNGNITGWDTSKVESFSRMFFNAKAFNRDINTNGSYWNVSSATDLSFMFGGAIAFNQNIGGWNLSNVTDMTNIFYRDVSVDPDSAMSAENYNAILIGWGASEKISLLQNGVNLNANLIYTSIGASEARTRLLTKWNINGDLYVTNTSNNQYTLTYNGIDPESYGQLYVYIGEALYNTHQPENSVYNWEASESGLTTFKIADKYNPNLILFNKSTNIIFKTIPSMSINSVNVYYGAANQDLPILNTNSDGLITYIFTDTNSNVVVRSGNQLDFINLGNTTIRVNIAESANFFAASTTFTVTVSQVPYCVLEGTKINTEDGYKCIEKLTKEDKVKTVNGYKNVYKISYREIEHRAINKHIPDQLYEYITNEEPLILTGRHSILVDNLTTEESEKVKEMFGRLYTTENKYRLAACLDKQSKVYSVPGTYNVYHVALENDNVYTNYGMYANGVLVETISKRNIDKIQ